MKAMEALVKMNQELLQANQELTAQIVRLSEIIEQGKSQELNPVQVIPGSYQDDSWVENPDFEDLATQRKAAIDTSIEELKGRLDDQDFLNTEITFDN